MAYIKSGAIGNLYLQDGGDQPKQLTNSGVDHSPVFSDDGQRIAFYRGGFRENNQVYTINVDESGEQALVTSDLLASLGLGYDQYTELRSLAFVPATHQLLFNTQQLDPINHKGIDASPKPNNDLLLVDADSSKIRRLIVTGQGGYFLVSPNGKMVAIQTADHIDVIDINGHVLRRNLITYHPDDDYGWTPMSWAQDTSKLFVMPPIPVSEIPNNIGWPVLRAIWQYSIDGKSPGAEIRLSPPPLGDSFSISPDGNWIAYSFYFTYGKNNKTDKFGVYLGNLRNGTSQLMVMREQRDEPLNFDGWSPDSKYFIFQDIGDQMYIGNIHGEITKLSRGVFLGWVDTNRYLYDGLFMGELGKKTNVRVAKSPSDFVLDNSHPIAFVFLKR
jgi:Tol biopolymer transport system component